MWLLQVNDFAWEGSTLKHSIFSAGNGRKASKDGPLHIFLDVAAIVSANKCWVFVDSQQEQRDSDIELHDVGGLTFPCRFSGWSMTTSSCFLVRPSHFRDRLQRPTFSNQQSWISKRLVNPGLRRSFLHPTYHHNPQKRIEKWTKLWTKWWAKLLPIDLSIFLFNINAHPWCIIILYPSIIIYISLPSKSLENLLLLLFLLPIYKFLQWFFFPTMWERQRTNDHPWLDLAEGHASIVTITAEIYPIHGHGVSLFFCVWLRWYPLMSRKKCKRELLGNNKKHWRKKCF